MIHCMLDLETMGAGPNAAIIEIGAVWIYDGEGPEPNGVIEPDGTFLTHERLVSLEGQRSGIDQETVEWWDGHRNPYGAFFRSGARFSLLNALNEFEKAMMTMGGSDFLWAKGSDWAWLGYAFWGTFRKVPWDPKSVRCLRTLAESVGSRIPSRNGRPHGALSDAKHQGQLLLGMIETLRKRRPSRDIALDTSQNPSHADRPEAEPQE